MMKFLLNMRVRAKWIGLLWAGAMAWSAAAQAPETPAAQAPETTAAQAPETTAASAPVSAPQAAEAPVLPPGTPESSIPTLAPVPAPTPTIAAQPSPSPAAPKSTGFLRSLTRALGSARGETALQAEWTGEPGASQTEGAGGERLEEAIERARKMGGEDAVIKSIGLGAPTEVFGNKQDLLNLLGENPRWAWVAAGEEGRPDPMLIPWVADKIIFMTQDAQARTLEGAGQLAEAREIYQRMANRITEPQYSARIRDRIEELDRKIEEQNRSIEAAKEAAASQAVAEQARPEPKLPEFVVNETRGIVYDPAGESMVMIGGDSLRPGDIVPSFPNVAVQSVGYQSVVFRVSNEYMTKDFEVKVEGNALENKALEKMGAK
ncbi:MAG: hypothetical protein NTW86_15735 [Candidatus Sumerlaeota bacterium]|nr:hypothetical protein [Candidatus Sumerlaeota bacterium]